MIVLSTPFAGKAYCFNDYAKGIKNLDYPKSKIFYLVMDNSNSKAFGKRIDDFAKSMKFKDYKRVVIERPQFTIENTADYAKVSDHCHKIYMDMQNEIPKSDFVYNVEDDVEVPPDSLKKLLNVFKGFDKAGTAVGSCCSRRLQDVMAKIPVAWLFKEVRVFPYPDLSDQKVVTSLRLKTVPPFGQQIIGAAHMGCWLTRTKLIEKIKFDDLHGFNANDIAWGYKLILNGYYTVIDWSVVTKHWWQMDGEKGFY